MLWIHDNKKKTYIQFVSLRIPYLTLNDNCDSERMKKKGNKCCTLYISYILYIPSVRYILPPTVVLHCYLGSKQPKSIYIHLYTFFLVFILWAMNKIIKKKKIEQKQEELRLNK